MFENKKIFILGMARSGYDAAKLLIKRNNIVIVNDQSEQEQEKKQELESLGIKVVLGSHPDDLLDESYDYIIKNPGIPFDHKYVKYAEEHGIPVITEIEMAYHLLPPNVKIIGITGTNGKTTTTTLTYEIIKKYKPHNTHLAGNIGFPLSGIVENIKENDILVMEIGIPQLHDMYNFKCNIAVLTNIFEAHLDMFKTKEYYNQTKRKIFNNQTEEDISIVNKENKEAYQIAQGITAQTKYFSSLNQIDGCYLNNDVIYYYQEAIIDIKDIKLQGIHNYENVMCAIMIAKEIGIPNEVIVAVLKEFKGVEHRIEFVRTYQGKSFYNDSKATNIKATQIALSAFKKPVILLLGGLERGQDFNELKPYLDYTKLVIAYGECKNRIVEIMQNLNIATIKVDTLTEAITEANNNGVTDDIILLSPASASWDQYKNYEIRGEEFKKIVEELK